jgi:ribulose-phosphate 3-epimerase
LNFRIEVDGGIAHDTVARVVEAGADMLVAGSAIFTEGGAEHNAREFLKLARAAAFVATDRDAVERWED